MPTEPNDEDRDYARRWTSPGLLNEAEIHALEHAHAAGRAAEREAMRREMCGMSTRDVLAAVIPLSPQQYEIRLGALRQELAKARLALAASEARENALREALGKLLPYALEDVPNDDPDHPDAFYTTTPEYRQAMRISKAALSAPRDTEALRAMLENAWKAGAVTGSEWRGGKGAVPPPFDDAAINAIVDRILSGGAA